MPERKMRETATCPAKIQPPASPHDAGVSATDAALITEHAAKSRYSRTFGRPRITTPNTRLSTCASIGVANTVETSSSDP